MAGADPAASDADLDDALSDPGSTLPRSLAALGGDILVLGAGGKMGPSLARMARRALDAAGGAAARARVIAVSRFGGDAGERDRAALEAAGVRTLRADLADRRAVAGLPDAPNVVFMAGQKFGTSDRPSRTWAMNAYVPALCAERWAGARAAVFSTGNVYALTPAAGPGSRESDAPAPVGEYAMSCLARERLWEHFAESAGTRVALVRLNYANALRYGVLTDLARRVAAGEPVDVTMGAVNVLWQGDANRLALAALAHAASPAWAAHAANLAWTVNLAGPDTLRVRDLATALGERLGRAPRFVGREAPDALLSDTTRLRATLGAPTTPLASLLDWTAAWIRRGGALLDRPTRFEVRDGRF